MPAGHNGKLLVVQIAVQTVSQICGIGLVEDNARGSAACQTDVAGDSGDRQGFVLAGIAPALGVGKPPAPTREGRELATPIVEGIVEGNENIYAAADAQIGLAVAVEVANQQGRIILRIAPVDSAGQIGQDLRRAKPRSVTGSAKIRAPDNMASDERDRVRQTAAGESGGGVRLDGAVKIREPDRLKKLGSPAAELHRPKT